MTLSDTNKQNFEARQNWKREYNENLRHARRLTTETISSFMKLSALIVGGTVTAYSVPILQESFQLSSLRISWLFFGITIILGGLVMLLEGRTSFIETWQTSQDVYGKFTLNFKRHAYTWFILMLSLLHPIWLGRGRKFVRHFWKNMDEAEYDGLISIKNAYVRHDVDLLAWGVYITFVLGILFIARSIQLK